MLERAAASVRAQTIPVLHILEEDTAREGAAVVRTRGLNKVQTPWTVFLDSDDELDPEYCERVLAYAEETGGDYIYPWFRVQGGMDPFPMFFGLEWDDDAPHQTTITFMVRTKLAQQLGFVPEPECAVMPDGNRCGEDFTFTLRCVELGAQIVHLPERLWTWHHHGMNASGLPGRGDAA